MKPDGREPRNFVIVVSAASRKGGKSTVAARLVAELGAEYGLKVSAGGRHAGGSLVSDPKVISSPGTDTGALVAAGASKVLWVNTPLERLGAELERALSMFSPPGLLVVEGGSAIPFLEPDFSIFLMGVPFEEFKPSAGPALEKSDLVLVNTSNALAGADRDALAKDINRRAPGAELIFHDADGFDAALDEAVRIASSRLTSP